ncbi:MAG: hypothetical protein ACTSXD_02040 [Candidatus Heimdallarchaeaceae archaeon]
MKSTEFLAYLEENNIILSEIDTRRIKDALNVVLNLLKVRGIILNKIEQEKLVYSLAKAIR